MSNSTFASRSGKPVQSKAVQQAENKAVTPSEVKSDGNVCETCGFVAKSDRGLAVHQRSHDG